MKTKQIFVMTIFVLLTTYAQAQDTIYKRDQTLISAKVISINDKEIEYIRFDDASGISRTIPVNEVYKIKYQNGQVKKINISKEKEIVIDKNKLWNDNSAYSNIQIKKKKTKVQKFIFSIGPRYEFVYADQFQHYFDISNNHVNAPGLGFGLSFPLKKVFEADSTRSILSLTYKFNINRFSVKDVWDIGNGNTYTDYVYDYWGQHFLTLDYRLKTGNKSFFAPSIGLCISGNVGIVLGFDYIISFIGFEVKYIQPDKGVLLGFNFAF